MRKQLWQQRLTNLCYALFFVRSKCRFILVVSYLHTNVYKQIHRLISIFSHSLKIWFSDFEQIRVVLFEISLLLKMQSFDQSRYWGLRWRIIFRFFGWKILFDANATETFNLSQHCHHAFLTTNVCVICVGVFTFADHSIDSNCFKCSKAINHLMFLVSISLHFFPLCCYRTLILLVLLFSHFYHFICFRLRKHCTGNNWWSNILYVFRIDRYTIYIDCNRWFGSCVCYSRFSCRKTSAISDK